MNIRSYSSIEDILNDPIYIEHEKAVEQDTGCSRLGNPDQTKHETLDDFEKRFEKYCKVNNINI